MSTPTLQQLRATGEIVHRIEVKLLDGDQMATEMYRVGEKHYAAHFCTSDDHDLTILEVAPVRNAAGEIVGHHELSAVEDAAERAAHTVRAAEADKIETARQSLIAEAIAQAEAQARAEAEADIAADIARALAKAGNNTDRETG